MLRSEDLIEAIYRAQSVGLAEDDVAVTLLSEDDVTLLTLRQAREHLAIALCTEPRT